MPDASIVGHDLTMAIVDIRRNALRLLRPTWATLTTLVTCKEIGSGEKEYPRHCKPEPQFCAWS